MSKYFIENSELIQLRSEKENTPGLRKSQLGAIFAIGSHFTLNESEPALIVMPTGTGKTAVLMLSPYVLKAEKTLVLSSSVLVRGQIAEELKSLKTLKNLKLYSGEKLPQVFEKNEKFIPGHVEQINNADVVIGIPKAINQLLEHELECDEDYFDLILVDEAHHLPASYWTKVVEKFPKAKKVLFTATPFRRDNKSINGNIIYSYPLSKAKEDGSFAEIEFHSAPQGKNQSRDEAIAKKAEEVFSQDRKAKLNHFLMVRTDTLTHARQLSELYKEKTKLNLVQISSKNSYKTIKVTINKLKSGQLDGIICVDMLGEGFDFPNLKIAAVHEPHKSEAITLQFIGRFTRTNSKDIGKAKFISIASDLQVGKHRLYEEGAAWQDLILDMSEGAVSARIEEQQIVSTFEDIETSTQSSDITLYNLTPYAHVKIYSANKVNFNCDLDFGKQVVEHKFLSEEHSFLVILTHEDSRPKWSSSNKTLDRQYFLYAIYFDQETKLLFIHSTVKTEEVYEDIFQRLTETDQPGWKSHIPKNKIHKVLLDMSAPEFYSIGMANRRPSSGESYKTTTGSGTQRNIKKADGLLYENGHMYCGGTENGEKSTIGYSSASKIWSNSYKNIAEFLFWCRLNAKKISSDRLVKTNSAYDFIPIAEDLKTLPQNIISANWGAEIYFNFPRVDIAGTWVSLIDLDFEINGYSTDKKVLKLTLVGDKGVRIPLEFSCDNGYAITNDKEYKLDNTDSLLPLLNSGAAVLQTSEFYTIIPGAITKWSYENIFDVSQMKEIDWAAHGTDIEVEVGIPNSVQSTLEKILSATKPNILVCDHGTGESADYISITDGLRNIQIDMYHVKASGTKKPGNRVDDLYEVCGQITKAAAFCCERQALVTKLTSRLASNEHKFINGNFAKLNGLLSGSKPIKMKMIIVQPGISKSKHNLNIATLLSAPDSFLRSLGAFDPIEVMCSR